MSHSVPNPLLSLASDTERKETPIAMRRAEVIRLKAKGYTNGDIAKQLGVSRKTITRDLSSEGVLIFVGELIRRQLWEIETSHPEDLPIRDKLRWRADLITKLLPDNLPGAEDSQKVFRLIIEDP
jgi:hypothetical protein